MLFRSLTCHILPPEFKLTGKESLEKVVGTLTSQRFKPHQISQISDAIPWLMSRDTWDKQKVEFRKEVKRLDKIRGEDFQKTFPELATLIEPDHIRLRPT